MSLFSGVKGPKAILSSTIASALAEYFVVDEDLIESNLLSDTKIVLYNLQLRKQVQTLPLNRLGRSTRITVTGSVKEVTFTWVWSFSSSDAWVRDATLKINGLRFKTKLEHVTAEESQASEESQVFWFSDSGTEDQEEGGMTGYIKKHMEMVIDALTLHIVDFEFTVEMPPPWTETGAPVSTPSSNDKCISIVFGGETYEGLSFGWKKEENPAMEPSNGSRGNETSSSVLKQRLTCGSFYANIVKIAASNDGVFEQSISLMNPFSYCIDATRHCEKRFRNVGTGLKLEGRPIGAEVEDGSGYFGVLVLHAGKFHNEVLTQLAMMLLPPTDDCEDDIDGSVQNRVPAPEEDGFVTSFVLPFSSVHVLLDNTRVSFSDAIIRGRADGTELRFDAERLLLESTSRDRDSRTSISVRGMKASMLPNIKVEMSEIETLDIRGVVRLTEPIRNAKLEMEGGTLSIKLKRVEVMMLSKSSEKQTLSQGAQVSNKGTSAGENDGSGSVAFSTSIPIAVNVAVQDARIKKSDGSVTDLCEVDLYTNPDEKTAGIHFAFCVGKLKTELLQLRGASLCALLPMNHFDEIRRFNFGAESGVVKAGFSTKDWYRAFVPPGQDHSSTKLPTVKLPYAQIASLKLHIALAGTGLEVKETSIITAPFSGKVDTTLTDLVRFYAQACLKRTPQFLSNAEVLGLNVVDTLYGKGKPIEHVGCLAVDTAMKTVKRAFAARKSTGVTEKLTVGVSLWRKGGTRADGIQRDNAKGKGSHFVAGIRAGTVN